MRQYSIHNYGAMIASPARTAAYADALAASCRPGTVVLDLGAGTGMMSLIACRAGATRVYAVEVADAIEIAREIAVANGVADRITFIQGRSTDISLPEPVDVIVTDLRGVLPMFGTSLASMIDARRFLAPDGIIIPSHDIVRCALVEAEKVFEDLVAPWRAHARGFDMSPAERIVLNTWRRANLPATALLTDAHDVVDLDYLALHTTNARATLTVPVVRSGTAHGLALWFDARLFGEFGFTNAPGPPSLHGQALFPLPAPVPVESGDVVEMELRAESMGADYIWCWDTHIRSAAGSVKNATRQSTFHGRPVMPSRTRP